MSARLVRNKSYKTFENLNDIMDRQLPAEIKKNTRTKMKSEVLTPLAVKVKAAANGRHARLAAESVAPKSGAKPYIVGGGKRGPLFYGSEFGGGPRSKRTSSYFTRSRSGRYYKVNNRHTTHQFRPHLGNGEGYWFNPTIEKDLDNVLGGIAEIISDTVEKHL